jgi:NDP-sugar pyrophosphorylase family protein
MAGRGSRFANGGTLLPKPLLTLWGRPFFWWAAESVRRVLDPVEMAFVVLGDHVRDFAIDRRIGEIYPDARIVVAPEVTSGAAETAKLGVEQLRHRGPVIVNDTDHAFIVPRSLRDRMETATLLSFRSVSPAYSYARLDHAGRVIGTVEKQVVSRHAIAGAYLFTSPAQYLDAWAGYESDRPYDESFVSGLYDRLIAQAAPVSLHELEAHISFGTPEELERLGPVPPQPWAGWL